MKIYRSSDYSRGVTYNYSNDENLTPLQIAYEFGRAEGGEIIHVWDEGNDGMFPDHQFYWDSCYRKYKPY